MIIHERMIAIVFLSYLQRFPGFAESRNSYALSFFKLFAAFLWLSFIDQPHHPL